MFVCHKLNRVGLNILGDGCRGWGRGWICLCKFVSLFHVYLFGNRQTKTQIGLKTYVLIQIHTKIVLCVLSFCFFFYFYMSKIMIYLAQKVHTTKDMGMEMCCKKVSGNKCTLLSHFRSLFFSAWLICSVCFALLYFIFHNQITFHFCFLCSILWYAQTNKSCTLKLEFYLTCLFLQMIHLSKRLYWKSNGNFSISLITVNECYTKIIEIKIYED